MAVIRLVLIDRTFISCNRSIPVFEIAPLVAYARMRVCVCAYSTFECMNLAEESYRIVRGIAVWEKTRDAERIQGCLLYKFNSVRIVPFPLFEMAAVTCCNCCGRGQKFKVVFFIKLISSKGRERQRRFCTFLKRGM